MTCLGLSSVGALCSGHGSVADPRAQRFPLGFGSRLDGGVLVIGVSDGDDSGAGVVRLGATGPGAHASNYTDYAKWLTRCSFPTTVSPMTRTAGTIQQVRLKGRDYTFTPGVDPGSPHAPIVGELTNTRGEFAGFVAINASGKRFVLAGPKRLDYPDEDDRAALAAIDAPKPAPCDCPTPGPTCPPR